MFFMNERVCSIVQILVKQSVPSPLRVSRLRLCHRLRYNLIQGGIHLPE